MFRAQVLGQNLGRIGQVGACDVRAEQDVIAEGDKVVARTTMTGTHLGDFFSIAPTRKKVTLKGVHIMRIADGRIAEHWGSNDDLSLMRQLGAIPE